MSSLAFILDGTNPSLQASPWEDPVIIGFERRGIVPAFDQVSQVGRYVGNDWARGLERIVLSDDPSRFSDLPEDMSPSQVCEVRMRPEAVLKVHPQEETVIGIVD